MGKGLLSWPWQGMNSSEHHITFPSHCSSTPCWAQGGCRKAAAKVTRERYLGELTVEAELGHPLTGGYFLSCLEDKNTLLLHRVSCLGSVSPRSPGELHQRLCPLPQQKLFLIPCRHSDGLGLGWGVSLFPTSSCPVCPCLSREPVDLLGNRDLRQASGGLKWGHWGCPVRNWKFALRVLGCPVGNWRCL